MKHLLFVFSFRVYTACCERPSAYAVKMAGMVFDGKQLAPEKDRWGLKTAGIVTPKELDKALQKLTKI